MRIRCPHCHHPIEVLDEAALSEINCPSCGSSLSLVSDETLSHHGPVKRTLGHFELLDKLGTAEADDTSPAQIQGDVKPGKLKYLRVLVDSADGDKVNVRVPLALIRTGIKLTTLLPDHASEKLSEQGVDLGKLSDMDMAELHETLRELQVDVDSSDGDVVRVFCE